jgi:hypothetical protein
MEEIDKVICNLKIEPHSPVECRPISLGEYYTSLNDFFADLYAFQVAGYYRYSNLNVWYRIMYFVENMVNIIKECLSLNLSIGKHPLFDDIIKALFIYNGIDFENGEKYINYQRKRRNESFIELSKLYKTCRFEKISHEDLFDTLDDFISKQEIITIDSFNINSIKNQESDIAFYEDEYSLFCDLRRLILVRVKKIPLYKKNYILYISLYLLPKLEKLIMQDIINKYEIQELIQLLKMFINSLDEDKEIYYQNEEIRKYLKMKHKIINASNNSLTK